MKSYINAFIFSVLIAFSLSFFLQKTNILLEEDAKMCKEIVSLTEFNKEKCYSSEVTDKALACCYSNFKVKKSGKSLFTNGCLEIKPDKSTIDAYVKEKREEMEASGYVIEKLNVYCKGIEPYPEPTPQDNAAQWKQFSALVGILFTILVL